MPTVTCDISSRTARLDPDPQVENHWTIYFLLSCTVDTAIRYLSHSALLPSQDHSCTAQSVCHTAHRSHTRTAAGSLPRIDPLHTLCKHTAARMGKKAPTQRDTQDNLKKQSKKFHCSFIAASVVY